MVEPSAKALTLRSMSVFRKEELEETPGGIALTEAAKVSRLAEAKRRGHSVIDVHSHPLARRDVAFSHFDLDELPPFAKYVQFKLPGRPFGALVFGRESYLGLAWNGGKPQPLTLRVVGEALAVPSWLSTDPGQIADESVFDRQIRALGTMAQRRIASLRVGVVGLGGTGSLVVQQLSHIGVRDFVLVEDDVVESSNLSRLAGATWRDVKLGRSKVAVARRLIQSVGRGVKVRWPGSLRSAASLDLLGSVDLLIGAVDNDGARLILAELAASRLLPYLDIGVSVEKEEHGDQGALVLGGRLSFYIPGGPCLACADEIDFGEAAEDLEEEALKSIRRERGYARDRRIEPALMPLNAAVVGQCMVEFLAFVSGFRRVERFFRYDASSQKIVKQNVVRQELCPVCVPAEGMGDRHHIERYSLQKREPTPH
jgi:hypothetical protein